MADSKSLMGLNLSVDNDLIAEAVRESIIASVAAGLSNKEQIVSEFVKASLTERVLVEDGSKPRYSNDKTCTRMEYVVRKAIIDIAKKNGYQGFLECVVRGQEELEIEEYSER